MLTKLQDMLNKIHPENFEEDFVRAVQRLTPTVAFLLNTDAYTEGLGFVVMDKTGKILKVLRKPQRGEQAMQEADALRLGQRWILDNRGILGCSDQDIIGILSGIDADAVRRAVAKGFSPSDDLNAVVDAVHDEERCVMDSVRVPGCDNVSDLMSRTDATPKEVEADPRYKRTLTWMLPALRDIWWNVENVETNLEKTSTLPEWFQIRKFTGSFFLLCCLAGVWRTKTTTRMSQPTM